MLRYFRYWTGLSQEEVGRRVNRSKATISRIENGQLGRSNLNLILDIVNVLDRHPGMVFSITFLGEEEFPLDGVGEYLIRKEREKRGGDTNDDDQ